MAPIFPTLILNARPAAGKSEISRYLTKIPLKQRIQQFYVGSMSSLDDFPMLWAWFEEDDLLEKAFSLPRLHSTSDEYFLRNEYWHVLIHRINIDYSKCIRDATGEQTCVIEFSRGVEHGGYRAAYEHLSDQILSDAAVLYVNVSFEESLRKNRVRSNPDRPYSLLQHSLEDEKMIRLYQKDDWSAFTSENSDFISVRDHQIPYVVFENEDDVTTEGGDELGIRLSDSLRSLWSLRQLKLGGS
jgi:hypothetical protein